jgi:hypothetical protein
LGPFPFGWERDLLTGDVEGAHFGLSGMDRLTGKDARHEARLNEVIFDTVMARRACASIFAVRCSREWHIRGCWSWA